MITDLDAQSPVLWSRDMARGAVAIRCDVCRFCQWRDPTKSILCQWGGPFDGYQTPDGVLLEADNKEEDDKD